MNLYIKIFATFILPITLGLIFTLFSLNTVLQNQEILINEYEQKTIQQVTNRFNITLKNMEKDIQIMSNSNEIIEAIELHDNNILTNWGRAFLGNFYSTAIFLDKNNFVISRATDQYRFGDKLEKNTLLKLNSEAFYKGIHQIDNKELLIFAKKIKNYTNSVVGTVILGITIDETFLKKHIDLKYIALKYTTSRQTSIYSSKLGELNKVLLFKTNINNIDKLKRFEIHKGNNKEIKDLQNFRKNILLFTIIVSVVIIVLLYFILTNFLRPYKKIYNLLLDFANNKIDFRYIQTASKNISKQSREKEIYNMAKAINKVSKKALKNEEILKKISHTDQLTKIFNRRKLDEILIREGYQSNRYNKPLSIILIDIDHFKIVNDTHGHQIGDKILKEFSSVIQKNLRVSDCFGRWGGEEFLVISTNTNIKGALSLTNNIKEIVKNEEYTNDLIITASFGVGEIQKGENIYNLISRTDEALYKAKNDGRDRIEKAD